MATTKKSPATIADKPKPEIQVQLQQIIGKFQDKDGRIRRAAHPVDSILLRGREVGQVGHTPGVGISLLNGVLLSPKEEEAIIDAVTKARGGVVPRFVKAPPSLDSIQILDDDEDTDEDDDE